MRYLKVLMLLMLGIVISGCSTDEDPTEVVRERYYSLEEYHAYLECKSSGGGSSVPLQEDIFSSPPFDQVRLQLVDTVENPDCSAGVDVCPEGFTCNDNLRCEKSCADDASGCPSGYLCSDAKMCQMEATVKKLLIKRCTVDVSGVFQCETNPSYGFFWKDGYNYAIIDKPSASYDVGVESCTLSRVTGQLERYQKSAQEDGDDIKLATDQQLPELSDPTVIYKWEERYYEHTPVEVITSEACNVGLVSSDYSSYFPTYGDDDKGERCQRKETFKLVYYDPDAEQEETTENGAESGDGN